MSVPTTRVPPGGRLAWFIFALGVGAYAVAVLGRTTLGVAGIQAVDHFGARASIIATFVVVQLIVYTAMQIPGGLMLDRFGPRRMITTGLAVMGVAQVVMALTESVSVAIPARAVLGAGDAFIFASVIRLLPNWFPPGRVPIVTQLVGLSGQAGQIASAIPFVWLLGARGWAPAFLAVAVLTLAASLAAALLLRDVPPGFEKAQARPGLRTLRSNLGAAFRHPGTRLGLWTHWTTSFAPMVFGLMWGFPYLTQGEGRSPAQASALITLLAIVGAIAGPVLGLLVQRHPLRRSNLVLAMVAAGVVPWIAVLCWPGPAPLWLLTVLCAGLALGGPGSAIGFDFARTFNPRHRLGVANSAVNIGGFSACIIVTLLIGVLLDVQSKGSAYTLDQFRVAMAIQLPCYALGILGIFRSRVRARRLLAEAGQPVPRWREALRREWAARQRASAARR
ncbi:MAG: MFS transporter [Dermatophilaceae bacterium]